jgi:hypothetical protein
MCSQKAQMLKLARRRKLKRNHLQQPSGDSTAKHKPLNSLDSQLDFYPI